MKRIDAFLEGVSSVAISGHIRPDGDCVGSTLGCYNYIKKNYPQIETVLYLDPVLETFSFLPRFDEILHDRKEHDPFDLFISLDCADLERLGDSVRVFREAKKTLCLDHHFSNDGFADENFIEADWSSASEVLYTMLDPEKVDRDCAVCLYTGIVHDTGVFQYSCTSSQTMNIAGCLMDFGFDFTKIIDETFYMKTHAQNRIMGKVLEESRLYADGKIVVGGLTYKDLHKYGVETKHLDGIVSQMRYTEGVEISAFFHQIDNGYKVSLRSNGMNVADVASMFGGGGHIRAAGCSVTCDTLDEAIAKVVPELEKVVKAAC